MSADVVLQAILQYRNTPDRDTSVSPALVLFGRRLRDYLPCPLASIKPRPEWILLQEDRENALAQRASRCTLDLMKKSTEKATLVVGDTVRLQNVAGKSSKRWDMTGKIEVLQFDKYLVKVDGSGRLILRNRHVRKILPFGEIAQPLLIPDSASTETMLPRSGSVIAQPLLSPDSPDTEIMKSEFSSTQPKPSLTKFEQPKSSQSHDSTGPLDIVPNLTRPTLKGSTRTSHRPVGLNPTWGTKTYAAVCLFSSNELFSPKACRGKGHHGGYFHFIF